MAVYNLNNDLDQAFVEGYYDPLGFELDLSGIVTVVALTDVGTAHYFKLRVYPLQVAPPLPPPPPPRSWSSNGITKELSPTAKRGHA